MNKKERLAAYLGSKGFSEQISKGIISSFESYWNGEINLEMLSMFTQISDAELQSSYEGFLKDEDKLETAE
jgi:hypothetical protein